MSADAHIPIRLSHLMRHSSVGSIVRSPKGRGLYLVIKDTREWTDKNRKPGGEEILYVEGVKGALDIREALWTPPVPDVKPTKNGGTRINGVCIPAVPFPKWTRCVNPKCEASGLLVWNPWRQKSNGEILADCSACRQSLVQMPWVIATEEGSLADFPYHAYVHKGSNLKCEKDKGKQYLKYNDETGEISCEQKGCICGIIIKEKSKTSFGEFTPRQPWLQSGGDDASLADILKLNDIRLHSSVTESALVIPPESRVDKESIVAKLYNRSDLRHDLDRPGSKSQQKSRYQSAASDLGCDTKELDDALEELQKGFPYYGVIPTGDDLFNDEYDALCGESEKEGDFISEDHSQKWEELSKTSNLSHLTRMVHACVAKVVAVHRLKEILVFKGFTRLGAQENIIPPDIDGSTQRLPALELYGEGVFVALNEVILQQWERHPIVSERAQKMRTRFKQSGEIINSVPEPEITPRFLLLHTLSHLICRQLESEAGYPAASLKERIYAETNRDQPMAGILIYVAVPDIAGSLGGLAEQAEPRRLLKLLAGAFEKAQWCSLDPVCGEHEGQGPDLLNKAACHGCVLVPEPSCPYGNVLLDRTFIKGSMNGNGEAMPGLLEVAEQVIGESLND